MPRRSKAFTLIEVLIVTGILAVLLPVLLKGIVGYSMLNAVTRDKIVAIADCQLVVEQIRSISKTASSLSEITAVDWANWAASNGVNNLSSEVVTVAYTDLDGSGDSLDDNPLAITVTVGWQSQEGRANNLSFSTLATLY